MFEELHAISQTIVFLCLQHPSTEELLNYSAVLITYGKAFETEDADEDSNLFGQICQPTLLDSSNTGVSIVNLILSKPSYISLRSFTDSLKDKQLPSKHIIFDHEAGMIKDQ
jgi:hypothetical protein